MSESVADSNSSDVECPTCGRTDFASERGVNVHHTRVHGESLTRKTISCSQCGDEITRQEWQISQSQQHFCSKRCWGEGMSERWSGENSPNWEGGSHPYGKGWSPHKRNKVRESQNHKCAGCGIDRILLGRSLDVHHIQKASSFDEPEEANAEENLVALCPSCHGKWELMSPLRPTNK